MRDLTFLCWTNYFTGYTTNTETCLVCIPYLPWFVNNKEYLNYEYHLSVFSFDNFALHVSSGVSFLGFIKWEFVDKNLK